MEETEIKQLLQKNLELSEENNKMLHHVRRVQIRQFYWNAIKFVIIIALALGSLYFLEPYLEKVTGIFSQVTGSKANISPEYLQQILKGIR